MSIRDRRLGLPVRPRLEADLLGDAARRALRQAPTPMEIYCPKCRWEPPPDARWQCTCRHVWNTFDTGGRCPSCGKVWRDTMCLACHKWSKHHDWYHDLPPVDALLEEDVAQAPL